MIALIKFILSAQFIMGVIIGGFLMFMFKQAIDNLLERLFKSAK